MHLERKLVDPVALLLLATWRKKRRWLLWVERKVRHVDVRKPLHALVIGAIVGTVAAPVLDYLNTEARYALAVDETSVMAHSSKQLGDLLTYDKKTDNFKTKTTSIINNFTAPTDALLVGNTLYVIEYGGKQGGNKAGGSLWKITLPANDKLVKKAKKKTS